MARTTWPFSAIPSPINVVPLDVLVLPAGDDPRPRGGPSPPSAKVLIPLRHRHAAGVRLADGADPRSRARAPSGPVGWTI